METINTTNRQIIGQTYSEARNDIYAIFRQAGIAEDTCEDLVQEVFMKIMGLDVIIASQLKALAVRIAYQKRIDYLRHRAYINKLNADMTGWQMEQTYTNSEAEVNDILQTEMKVVSTMSRLDSQTYMLSRFEDKTAEEIARTLNLTKRAVESRLYRTRNMVRGEVKRVIGL